MTTYSAPAGVNETRFSVLAFSRVKVMALGLGWRSLPPMRLSYTLCRPCQPCAVIIRNASSTLLATPAMPPAAWTVSSHACCSGRMRPVGVLTSILANTATCWPTISGVIVMSDSRSGRRCLCTGQTAQGGHWHRAACRCYCGRAWYRRCCTLCGCVAGFAVQMARRSCCIGGRSVTVPHCCAMASATP
jgi:hypothetical protein